MTSLQSRAGRVLVVVAAIVGWPGRGAADEASRCAALAEAAQSQRDGGRLVEALNTLTSCSRDTCPGVVKRDCIRWLEEVQNALPTIIFHATDPAGHDLVDVRVLVDGSVVADRLVGRPLPLDPGVHHARFEMAGRPPVTRELVVVEAQRNRIIEVQLEGPPANAMPSRARAEPVVTAGSASTSTVLPWALVGVGIASLTAFGVLEIVAQGEYSELQDGCGRTRSCSESALSPARTKFIFAGVTLAAGLAASGAGVTLLLLRAPSSSSTGDASGAHGRLVAAPASGGGGLRFEGVF